MTKKMAKKEVLSVINHELRTPLTATQGYLELAQTVLERLPAVEVGHASYQQLALFLRNASEQAMLAVAMVEDLHALHGGFILRPTHCDVGEITRTTVTARRLLVPTRLILLEMMAEKTTVWADPVRVRQVISNYLNNALKYTNAGPIAVSVRLQGKMVCVAIRDEGPGIPDEQQRHVWKKGYRAIRHRLPRSVFPFGALIRGKDQPLPAGEPVREGLGLGLFICKLFIERMHGSVGLESAPGQGSTFGFTLPLCS